ncbi:hypothetical protein [Streptomyces sp. NPDC005017]|uniref:hypothetical protein n=1 Tax=Streptomyces sp. NPDC005017 TaxID=3364706 RepID=UPI0036A89B9B
MTVDPTDPDTFEVEETRESEEFDVEAPEADTAEQNADVAPEHDERMTGADRDRADEADLIEQTRIVSLDEDDYR